MVIRVPFTGAEKESLKVSLDRHRTDCSVSLGV